MHKVFGEKEDVRYVDRKGAYLIAIKDNKVAVIKTQKGYFLLGGGMENDETDEACIIRECLEETGYTVKIRKKVCSAETYARHPQIGYFHPIQNYYYGELLKQVREATESGHSLQWIDYGLIRGRMFTEMQNWALEQCWQIVK